PFIERSLELTVRALEDARVEATEIDSLILSGGSSRIPLVRRLIEERLGLRPSGGINPDEIVALGAAVEGALMAGSERLTVRDVVSRSYGVEIDGGRFTPLIRKNSPVPATRQRMFTTVTDNQDSVEIHVLQGESTVISENLSLGRFLLAGLRPVTAGMPRIAVDFTIDESNILHVSARDLESGSIQAITIVDLDRGSSDESAEALAGKISGLRARLEELRSGAKVEGSLDTEVQAAIEGGASVEPSLGVDKLRVLRAELEGLVGELLSRAVRAPMREAALREAPTPVAPTPVAPTPEDTDDTAPVHAVQPAGKKKDRRRRDTQT
ncbi:MAG: Hsp70 family protein, partial [Rectinemataceae bacterium]